jgi:glycerophosphoryl diester phosphodiesterase
MMHTIVTLHSGALGSDPNSREYLNLAAEFKPDLVELDVRCSSDGVALLYHDPAVIKENESYLIAKTSFAVLQDAVSEILPLEEALIFCRRKKLFMNLDIKTPETAGIAIDTVRRQGMTSDILFSGCRREEILDIRRRLPDSRVLLNVDEEELRAEGGEYMDNVVRNVYQASELGCCGLNVNYLYCRPELISYARTRGLPVMVWTIDDEMTMRKFLSWGAYSITTNRIDLFYKIRGFSAVRTTEKSAE